MRDAPLDPQVDSREFIIGTAGHIDHGKTVLIKALTGRDTDRLKEEKERGISIDLGFAPFDLGGGRIAGIVDVPGHEHFVRNMLSGATGMDLVLLTIAADDGVMPQTREHLAILDLLGVSKGVAVITKVDLVEEDLVDLVEEEIEELLRGSSLQGSPVVRVSGITGEGIEELRKLILQLSEQIEEKDLALPPRLPIDRVFKLKGIGTVVTGTLWSGIINKGDNLQMLPDDRVFRVKSLQVHDTDRDAVFAGERVAVNLSGSRLDSLTRGDVLSSPGFLGPSHMLDARVRLLESAPRPLKRRTRLRIHHGTREVMGRMYPIDRERLSPGDSCFAQLRLESPVVPRHGDRFIIRSYSPITTIGGGVVLDPHAHKHRSRDLKTATSRLSTLESGRPSDVIATLVEEQDIPSTPDSLSARSGLSVGETEGLISLLVDSGDLVPIGVGREHGYLPGDKLEEAAGLVEKEVEGYLRDNPLAPGLKKELLKQRALGSWPDNQAEALLQDMQEKGRLRLSGGIVDWPNRRVELSENQESLYAKCLQELIHEPFSPPTVRQLSERLETRLEEVNALLKLGESRGDLLFVSTDICFHKEALLEMKGRLSEYLRVNDTITVSEFRTLVGTTRKYAVPLLEYFDRTRFTVREGDLRRLR